MKSCEEYLEFEAQRAAHEAQRAAHEAQRERAWRAAYEWDRLAWHRSSPGYESPAEELKLAATEDGKNALRSALRDPNLRNDPTYQHFFSLAGIQA